MSHRVLKSKFLLKEDKRQDVLRSENENQCQDDLITPMLNFIILYLLFQLFYLLTITLEDGRFTIRHIRMR